MAHTVVQTFSTEYSLYSLSHVEIGMLLCIFLNLSQSRSTILLPPLKVHHMFLPARMAQTLQMQKRHYQLHHLSEESKVGIFPHLKSGTSIHSLHVYGTIRSQSTRTKLFRSYHGTSPPISKTVTFLSHNKAQAAGPDIRNPAAVVEH